MEERCRAIRCRLKSPNRPAVIPVNRFIISEPSRCPGRFARGTAGSRLYCGDWQAEYMELHASMLRGERPPRFAVAHGISGLADNL